MNYREKIQKCFLTRNRKMFTLIILSISACSSNFDNHYSHQGWLSMNSKKELEIKKIKYQHAVYFSTDSYEISSAEENRLFTFLDAVEIGKNDSVFIDGYADNRSGNTYNYALASRRSKEVKKIIGQQIYEANLENTAYGEIDFTKNNGNKQMRKNRRVDITVQRHIVVPPACPNWSKKTSIDYDNGIHSNFGCSTKNNLALMVNRPADFVFAGEIDRPDTDQQVKIIYDYRKGQSKAILNEGLGQ